MKDTLVTATVGNGALRLIAVSTTNLANEARNRHSLSFLCTSILSRAMSTGLLLARSMKVNQGRVTIKIQSDGPINGLFIDAGRDGTVRGYVGNPSLELDLVKDACNKPYFNFAGATGKGYLHVTRDIGKGEPFTSTVELIEGGIGEDIASYLFHSEQTESAVFVGEKIENNKLVCSGALLAQVMPKAKNENNYIKLLNEDCINISSFNETMYKNIENIEHIFVELFPSINKNEIKILEINNKISFHCKCSIERSLNALKLLGKEELIKMTKEEKKAELICKFCNSKYIINELELNQIINEL